MGVCSGVTYWEPGCRWGCGVGNCCLGKDDIFALGRVAVGLWRRLLEGRLHFSAPLD